MKGMERHINDKDGSWDSGVTTLITLSGDIGDKHTDMWDVNTYNNIFICICRFPVYGFL